MQVKQFLTDKNMSCGPQQGPLTYTYTEQNETLFPWVIQAHPSAGLKQSFQVYPKTSNY